MALTRAKRNKQIAYQQMKDLHRMATELLRQRGEQFLAAGAVEHHVVQGVMRKKYVTVAKATKAEKERRAVEQKRMLLLKKLPGGERHLEEEKYTEQMKEEAALLAESEKKEDMPVLSEKLLKKLKMYAQGDGIDEADAQVYYYWTAPQSLSGVQKAYAKWSTQLEKV
ncbi:unnamed protein product, partial [Symbiodinium sp. KB8]